MLSTSYKVGTVQGDLDIVSHLILSTTLWYRSSYDQLIFPIRYSNFDNLNKLFNDIQLVSVRTKIQIQRLPFQSPHSYEKHYKG